MPLIKILIIGAYPKKRAIYGGFVADSIELRKSILYKYCVVEFDSSQRSNPPPIFIVRLFFAILRFIKLVFIKFSLNPTHVIILFPSGFGALEKLFYSFFIFNNSKNILMPRAGKFYDEVLSSNVLRYMTSKNKKSLWFVQGSSARNILKNYIGINCEKIKIIFPFIDVPTHLHIKSNKILHILYVGWLEKNKGILDLIKICKLINFKFKLDIYGDGSLRPNIEELSIVDQRINFFGFIDRSSLLECYSSYDILILPSYSEGFPNCIAESMSQGLAILSTNVGQIPDFIDSECLYPPGQITRCIDLLKKINDDRFFLESQKRRNYEFAKRNFGVKFLSNYL